jgi:hypothetical protein
MSAGISLTKPEEITFYYRNASLRGLAVEVYTGMVLSNRGSGLDACRLHGLLDPTKRTTKKAGLRNAVKAMKLLYPDWTVSKTIQMALDKK